MTVKVKTMTSIERKVLKAKKKNELPVFEETSTPYFTTKDTTTRCAICKKFILAGSTYRTSTDSRHFKHAECKVDGVKQ